MTAPSAAPPGHPLFRDLDLELASTRRVLERVPGAHFDFRPHPRSMALGQLAAHLANMPTWGAMTLTLPELDLAAPAAPGADRSGSPEAVLAHFDRGAAEFRAALAGADAAALAEPWTVRRGDAVVFRAPRAAMLRGMVVNHMVHHRGQLTVYLRLLDVPVPGLYGPSADEAPPGR